VRNVVGRHRLAAAAFVVEVRLERGDPLRDVLSAIRGAMSNTEVAENAFAVALASLARGNAGPAARLTAIAKRRRAGAEAREREAKDRRDRLQATTRRSRIAAISDAE